MSLPPLAFNAWLRYGVIMRFIDRFRPVNRVLEIGAGGGALAARLAQRYDYTGVELDDHSAALAQRRLSAVGRGRLVHGDVSLVAGEQPFDVACAFEVIEHIRDDVGALVEWSKLLRPSGGVVVSVPAQQKRFSSADELAGHIRRYDRDQLIGTLEAAGLADPAVVAYGFPAGYALEAARNALARRRIVEGSVEEKTAGSGRWMQPQENLGWLTAGAMAPFRAIQRPFEHTAWGTGFVACARKP